MKTLSNCGTINKMKGDRMDKKTGSNPPRGPENGHPAKKAESINGGKTTKAKGFK